MRRRKARRARRRRVAALGGALLSGLGGGARAVVAVRRRRGGGAPAEWRCDCGQAFRVAGAGRHRVYWLAEAPDGEPVLSGRCPACDGTLPAGRRLPARAAGRA